MSSSSPTCVVGPSLTIAHHFAALREIPANNILYLDWPYSTDEVSVDVFREKLLIPMLGAVSSRGIAPQIDYIVYSSDFPWSIDFKSLLGSQKVPPQFTPVGSLTSLTFFATPIMSNDYRFIAINGNHYFRRSDKDHLDNPSLGFRGWYGFNDAGKLVEGGGASYVLSTMLGVTSNNGMSVDDIVSYLKRSAAADGTKPAGTIYLCKTGDVHRSGTREPGFPAAVAALKKLHVRSEVVTGKLPLGKKRRGRPANGDAQLRLEGLAKRDFARRDLREPHKLRRQIRLQRRDSSGLNDFPPCRRRRREWRRGRAVCYRAENFLMPSCKFTTPAAARWPRLFTSPWPRRFS